MATTSRQPHRQAASRRLGAALFALTIGATLASLNDPGAVPITPTQEEDARTNALEASCERGNPVACDELGQAPSADPAPGASEPSLEALTEIEMVELSAECIGGDMTACDRLFWGSPNDSEYETLALDCGGHGDFPCAASSPDTIDVEQVMADLATNCIAGDPGACDDLWWMSPSESAWEQLAETCGGNEGSFPCSI